MPKIIHYTAGENIQGSVKLSSNESAFVLSPAIKKAIIQELNKAHIYPDITYNTLKKHIIKKYVGIQEHNIIVGNGSDEVLSLIAQVLFNKDEHIIIAKNTFSIYTIVSQLAKTKITYINLQNGITNITTMEKHITKKTRAVFLCNPNNPTGTAQTAKDIYIFASKLPKNTYLILDEAYIDFAQNKYKVEPSTLLKKHSLTIILHTFSKIFALAGMRIGYGITNTTTIKKLENAKMPFNINCFANVAAQAALQDNLQYKKVITHITQERHLMITFFIKHKIDFFESQTNFFCINAKTLLKNYFKHHQKNKKITKTTLNKISNKLFGDILYDIFAKHKIIIRSLTSFTMPNHVRITLGTKSDNKKVRSLLLTIAQQ